MSANNRHGDERDDNHTDDRSPDAPESQQTTEPR